MQGARLTSHASHLHPPVAGPTQRSCCGAH